MPKPQMTGQLAHAASMDAGNRSMRKAGRAHWNQDDYNACWLEYGRLWPIEAELAARYPGGMIGTVPKFNAANRRHVKRSNA